MQTGLEEFRRSEREKNRDTAKKDMGYKKMKKKLTQKEVKRLLKKYEKIEHRFAIIDEAIDRSLMVSRKTLDMRIDI